MLVTERLLTIDDYLRLPENDRPTELVRGRVVEGCWPTPRHGLVCSTACLILGRHIARQELGHLLINGTGIITGRNPDTLRGADIAYYSYTHVPPGPLPDEYLSVPPELVFEVLSSDDRWSKLLAKVAEYLEAGVTVVCVLGPKTSRAHVYYADQSAEILSADDELSFPEILGEFRVRVGRFFE